MDDLWTIAELVTRAAGVLAADQPVRLSGRVREMPNERLIRWYVTVGVVNPPLARRGRVALYGRRHLLQLVAIKRRQAEGRSLAQVQVELAGATNESLEAIAILPEAPTLADAVASGTRLPPPESPRDTAAAPEVGAASDTGAASEVGAPSEAGGEPEAGGVHEAGAGLPRFWVRREPGVLAADTAGGDAEGHLCGNPHGRSQATLLYGISLAPGMTLLLEGPLRAPDPEDVAAIESAARPILDTLAGRGIADPAPTPPPRDPEPPGAPVRRDNPDGTSLNAVLGPQPPASPARGDTVLSGGTPVSDTPVSDGPVPSGSPETPQ